jgi:hypothetical protein
MIHGGKYVDKKPLILFSLSTMILLTIGSFSTVVEVQAVQSFHQQGFQEEINQKELVFQTLCDLANDKEIQRIILKSQMNRGIFPASGFPVVTKNQIESMYFFGQLFSKMMSAPRLQFIGGLYQYRTQEMQQRITTYVEKTPLLMDEITRVADLGCDCDNNGLVVRDLPVFCQILLSICTFFSIFPNMFFVIWCSALVIAILLKCDWTLPQPES